jgi:hypothetical protein
MAEPGGELMKDPASDAGRVGERNDMLCGESADAPKLRRAVILKVLPSASRLHVSGTSVPGGPCRIFETASSVFPVT